MSPGGSEHVGCYVMTMYTGNMAQTMGDIHGCYVMAAHTRVLHNEHNEHNSFFQRFLFFEGLFSGNF